MQTFSNFTFQPGTSSFNPAVVTNLAATGIAPETATLAGQVLSTGGSAPTIIVYYGPSDGRTNPVNWAFSTNLGIQSGAFSAAIAGLSPNTTYYYTANAANIGGSSWASPSESFTTTAVTLPQVANAPATGIGGTIATLNGQITATGGAAPSVTLFYGPTDQGANAANWASNIVIGAQTGGVFADDSIRSPRTRRIISRPRPATARARFGRVRRSVS